MKKIVYPFIVLFSSFVLLSCEDYKEKLTNELRATEDEVLEDYDSPGGNALCETQYDGYEGNYQVSSQCMTAYNYICTRGESTTSDPVLICCQNFKNMGGSVDECKYCQDVWNQLD